MRPSRFNLRLSVTQSGGEGVEEAPFLSINRVYFSR